MNDRTITFFALALLAGALAAPAEEPLTLRAAAERALASHPALAAGRARLTEAGQAVGEARASRGPISRLLLTATEYGEPIPVTPIHGFSPRDFPPFDDRLVQGSLSLNYTLFDSGARRERVLQALANQAGSGAALTAAEQALLARVAAAYATVGARAELLAAARQKCEALAAESARVEQFLAAGRVAEVERLRAEAALAGSDADAARAATALDSAERDLARLLDLDVAACRAERLETLAPAAREPRERGALAARAEAASPAVAQAAQQLAAARAAASLARTAYFPELKAVGALQQLGDAALDFSTEWNLGLQLSIPIWDGSATERRVARARALAAEAEARLAQAQRDAREAVDRALAAGAEAAARADALVRAEARLTEVARIQRLLLEAGRGTQIDYLAAEADLAATRAGRLEAETQRLLAGVDLARAVGELSLDWLDTHLAPSPENQP